MSKRKGLRLSDYINLVSDNTVITLRYRMPNVEKWKTFGSYRVINHELYMIDSDRKITSFNDLLIDKIDTVSGNNPKVWLKVNPQWIGKHPKYKKGYKLHLLH